MARKMRDIENALRRILAKFPEDALVGFVTVDIEDGDHNGVIRVKPVKGPVDMDGWNSRALLVV